MVVYRADDGRICDIHWRVETSFQPEDLSGVAGTPPADGDPVAYYIPGADVNQVTYRSGTSLFELWWVGDARVTGWDLTAASGAPPALSDPAAYYSAGTNTKHVIYRSENDHLYEIWWVPGSGAPAVVDLTLMGLARRAVDKPAAYTVEGPNSQHVVYCSADNEIREICWNRTDVVVPTGPPAQGDDMQPREILDPDRSTFSRSGHYRFTYQPDGNLVLYDGSAPLWASARTAGPPVSAPCSATATR